MRVQPLRTEPNRTEQSQFVKALLTICLYGRATDAALVTGRRLRSLLRILPLRGSRFKGKAQNFLNNSILGQSAMSAQVDLLRITRDHYLCAWLPASFSAYRQRTFPAGPFFPLPEHRW